MTRSGMAKRLEQRKLKRRNVMLMALRLLQYKLGQLSFSTTIPMRKQIPTWPRSEAMLEILYDGIEGELFPAELVKFIDELCETL